jgi:hypothetical protein
VATAIVIIAATVVVAAVVVAVIASRRTPSTRGPENEELVRAVDEMRTKMDELAGGLSEALERPSRRAAGTGFSASSGTPSTSRSSWTGSSTSRWRSRASTRR